MKINFIKEIETLTKEINELKNNNCIPVFEKIENDLFRKWNDKTNKVYTLAELKKIKDKIILNFV